MHSLILIINIFGNMCVLIMLTLSFASGGDGNPVNVTKVSVRHILVCNSIYKLFWSRRLL